jgi:hypothetical protein
LLAKFEFARSVSALDQRRFSIVPMLSKHQTPQTKRSQTLL